MSNHSHHPHLTRENSWHCASEFSFSHCSIASCCMRQLDILSIISSHWCLCMKQESQPIGCLFYSWTLLEPDRILASFISILLHLRLLSSWHHHLLSTSLPPSTYHHHGCNCHGDGHGTKCEVWLTKHNHTIISAMVWPPLPLPEQIVKHVYHTMAHLFHTIKQQPKPILIPFWILW